MKIRSLTALHRSDREISGVLAAQKYIKPWIRSEKTDGESNRSRLSPTVQQRHGADIPSVVESEESSLISTVLQASDTNNKRFEISSLAALAGSNVLARSPQTWISRPKL